MSSSPAIGSSCDVGSSSSTRRGRPTSAAASATRCSSPPERVSTARSSRCGIAERQRHLLDGARPARRRRARAARAAAPTRPGRSSRRPGSPGPARPVRPPGRARLVRCGGRPARRLHLAGHVTAVVVGDQAAAGTKQGRLSRSRAPGEHDELTRLDLEPDVPQGIGAGFRVAVGEPFDADKGISHAGSASPRTAGPPRSPRMWPAKRGRTGVHAQRRVGVEAAGAGDSRRDRNRRDGDARRQKPRRVPVGRRRRAPTAGRAVRVAAELKRRGDVDGAIERARHQPRAPSRPGRPGPRRDPRSAAASARRAWSAAASGTSRAIRVAVSAERRASGRSSRRTRSGSTDAEYTANAIVTTRIRSASTAPSTSASALTSMRPSSGTS